MYERCLPDFDSLDEERHLKFVKAIRLISDQFKISEVRFESETLAQVQPVIDRLRQLYNLYLPKNKIISSAIFIALAHIEFVLHRRFGRQTRSQPDGPAHSFPDSMAGAEREWPGAGGVIDRHFVAERGAFVTSITPRIIGAGRRVGWDGRKGRSPTANPRGHKCSRIMRRPLGRRTIEGFGGCCAAVKAPLNGTREATGWGTWIRTKIDGVRVLKSIREKW